MKMLIGCKKYLWILVSMAMMVLVATKGQAKPLPDGLWHTENGSKTVAITDNHLWLFEGAQFEGSGTIIQVSDGWQAKIKKREKEYNAIIKSRGDILDFSLDGEMLHFNYDAPRRSMLEKEVEGEWLIEGRPEAKIMIYKHFSRLTNKETKQEIRYKYSIFGQYWLNAGVGEYDDRVSISKFTFDGNKIDIEDDSFPITLRRITEPQIPQRIEATSSHADEQIKRLENQEARLIAELEQNNRPAKRAFLAWLRHDRAAVMFEKYKATKDESDMDAALAYAESATELSPDTARIWKTFGFINLAAKRGMLTDIQAEGSFKRAIEINPEDAEARYIYIDILLKNEEYKHAAEQYVILFEQMPGIIIEGDLHKMNLAFISAGVAGWGVEIYDGYLDKHPKDPKVMIAKSILLRADDEKGDMAEKTLVAVIKAADTPENIKQTAKNIEDYWARVEMFGDLEVEP
jgi:tetratricopeptide (TPR) repeat protein